MNIPCKDGIYAMGDDLADAYRKIYPSADHEFASMRIWLEVNPARRPASPKSAPRFVANWFSRVPKLSPQRDARTQTLAALTGGADGAIAGCVGGSDIRADRRHVWSAENVIDVDWSVARGGEANLGAGAGQVPARRLGRSGAGDA